MYEFEFKTHPQNSVNIVAIVMQTSSTFAFFSQDKASIVYGKQYKSYLPSPVKTFVFPPQKAVNWLVKEFGGDKGVLQ